ncbi:MAG: AmmeMemoRadiSam system protein B [Candidatus Schekmanbacteria bacterium]|nr:MAG: AmmeMemoRadiSam system protein B [Candidatus Schekmanbacteria bacterium]
MRESVLSGSWYPNNKEELRQDINSYLDKAEIHKEKEANKPLCLISPHAGYIYSGQVAAYAYKQILGKDFKRVIIIAPSHRYPLRSCALFDTGAFETPLGLIPVDEEFCSKLKEGDTIFQSERAPHIEEHSLEIQLPFLQVVLREFKIVPMLFNDYEIDTCTRIAESLHRFLDAETLVVSSSDLSHFYPQRKAELLDHRLIEHIRDIDAEGLVNDLKNGRCEACGASPIVISLLLAKMSSSPSSAIYRYATSGDVTGDYDEVVGYLAAGLYKD